MAYDLASSIIPVVKRRANDSSISDDLITDHVQAVQDEIAGRYQLRESETSLTGALATDDTEIDLAVGEQAIITFELVPDAATEQVLTPHYVPYRTFLNDHAQRLVTTVQPYCYTIYGNKILLPGKVDQDYTMTIRYLTASTDVSTTLLIPQEFKEIYVRAGLAGVEEDVRGNFDMAAVHRRKIEDLTEDFVGRYTLRQISTAPKATLGGRQVGRVGRFNG